MVTTSNIYLITNLIDNKQYVGQTINIEERWYRHSIDYKRLTGKYLYRAMNKYGFENFKFEVVESDVDINLVSDREMFWIAKLNTMTPNGYNMTEGGEGSIGRKQTKETKEKISKINKGRKRSEESKLKMSESQKERNKDSKERQKMSESHKNNKKLIEQASKRIVEYNNSLTEEEKRILFENRVGAVIEARGKKVKGINIHDGSVINFNSMSQAARWIQENTEYKKACRTNISKACKGQLDYVYNYKWEIVQ